VGRLIIVFKANDFFDGVMVPFVAGESRGPDKRSRFEEIIAGVEIPPAAYRYQDRGYQIEPKESVKTNAVIVKAKEALSLSGEHQLKAVRDLISLYDTNFYDREKLTYNGLKTFIVDQDQIPERGPLPNWPVGVTTIHINSFECAVCVKVIANLILDGRDPNLVRVIEDHFLNSAGDGSSQLILELIGELDFAGSDLLWKDVGRKCLNEVLESAKKGKDLRFRNYYLSIAMRHGELTPVDITELLKLAPLTEETGGLVLVPEFLMELESRLNDFIRRNPENLETFKQARNLILQDNNAPPGALCAILKCGHYDSKLDMSRGDLVYLMNCDSRDVRLAAYKYIEELGERARPFQDDLFLIMRAPEARDLDHLDKVLKALAASADPDSLAMQCVYSECRKGLIQLFRSDRARFGTDLEPRKIQKLSQVDILYVRDLYGYSGVEAANNLKPVCRALVNAAPRDMRVAKLFYSACCMNSPLFRFVLFGYGSEDLILPSGGDMSLVGPSFKKLLKTSASDQRRKIISYLLKNYKDSGAELVDSVVLGLRANAAKINDKRPKLVAKLQSLSDHIAAELDFARNQLSPPGPTA
jgi:hypothetical protein